MIDIDDMHRAAAYVRAASGIGNLSDSDDGSSINDYIDDVRRAAVEAQKTESRRYLLDTDDGIKISAEPDGRVLETFTSIPRDLYEK